MKKTELVQTHLLILRSLPKRQEAMGAQLGNTDTGGRHLGELVLRRGHWCRQAPFWNPPFSLITRGPGSTHQQAFAQLEC